MPQDQRRHEFTQVHGVTTAPGPRIRAPTARKSASVQPAPTGCHGTLVACATMKSTTAPQLEVHEARRSFTWVDGAVMLALLALLWSAMHFGKGMLVHFEDRKSVV